MPGRSAASEAEIHSAGMDTSPFPGPGHGGFPRGLATAAGHPTLTSINVDEPVDYQSIIKLTIRVCSGHGGLAWHRSISWTSPTPTSDQMIAHKFRGKLDRAAIIDEMT